MSKEVQGNIDLRQIKSDARQGDANTLLTWEGGSSPTTGSLVKIGATGGADELPLSGISTEYVDGTGAFSTPSGGTGTVTHTGGALTADLPVFGAGSADIKVGTKSGNTDEVATSTGAKTTGHLATWDANGNLVDGGASPSSPTTTKGDLIVRGASVDGRLAVGTDGYIPMADSAQTLGIKWIAPSTSGSGLATITSGTRASLPGSGANAGDYYVCNDTDYTFVWSGSVWVARFRGMNVTEPIDSGFSWVNQGSSAVDSSKGGIYLSSPADTANSFKLYVKSAPATPWTWRVTWYPSLIAYNYCNAGIALRESSTGKLYLFGMIWGALSANFSIVCEEYTDPTTYAGVSVFSPWATDLNGPGYAGGSFVTFEISDPGSGNLSFGLVYGPSANGYVRVMGTSGRTSFMAGGPNQIGYYVNPRNTNSAPAAAWFVHSTQ